MTRSIPPMVRVRAFASTELALDTWYALTKFYKLDLEAIWILLVIGHQTMRPWILDDKLAAEHLSDETVPDAIRGSISRLLIADRTGLSRETVRRRVAELMKMGLVVQDGKGSVRAAGDKMQAPALHEALAEISKAVRRYQTRVDTFEAKFAQAPSNNE